MVIFCIHNSMNFENTSGCSAKLNHEPVVQMVVDTHCCAFLLTSPVHTDDDLKQKVHIWIHQFITPVATDLSVRSDFLTAAIPLRLFIYFNKQNMDQLMGQLYLKIQLYHCECVIIVPFCRFNQRSESK